MLASSTGGEDTNHSNTNNNINKTRLLNSVSSSISSTSSSSSSPFSPPDFQTQKSNNNNSKTMEEVWKDINLASLQDPPQGGDQLLDLSVTHINPRLLLHHNTNPHHQNPNFTFQDFLARPISKDPPTRITSSRGNLTSSDINNASDHHQTSALYGSSPTPPAPPATVLSLYSGPPGFDFLDHSSDHNHPPRPISPHFPSHHSSNDSSFISAFEGLDSSPGLLAYFGRKRGQESNSGTGDRKHKRMIKNRESAARSRARKQAYTNELELEVAHLTEENARLRREQEELRLAAVQLPKKHSLHRTSTAPF